MRNWIAIILLLFVSGAAPATEPQTAYIHIGPDGFTTETHGLDGWK